MRVTQQHLRICSFASACLCLAFVAMCVPAWHRFTSLTLDSDAPLPGALRRWDALAVVWPGNGTVFFGFERNVLPLDQPLDRLDVGAVLFDRDRVRPLVRLHPRSSWNRLGFWHLDRRDAENAELLAPKCDSVAAAFWVGVPCYLPAISFGGLPLLIRRRSRDPYRHSVILPPSRSLDIGRPR